ncbi:MAG TPA: hypothetical protein VM434_01555 [Beijerinckiaceae bacterium]|nr:hypothetical protein [Beijerinckiaceae bacterium]
MDHGDWSIGIGTANSLADAKVLAALGGGLRSIYAPILAEPPPERIAALLKELDRVPPPRGRKR